jgi:hypothetical protein
MLQVAPIHPSTQLQVFGAVQFPLFTQGFVQIAIKDKNKK